jgi:hypothetical protein
MISKDKNRLLKVCYVPATSAGIPRKVSSFFDATINSINEANKASGMRHSSVHIT